MDGVKRWNRKEIEAYQMWVEKWKLVGVEGCAGVDLEGISAEAALPRV